MRSATTFLVVAFFTCAGCTYSGNLKDDFFAPRDTPGRLPLRAYLVFGSAMESSAYRARNVFLFHGADIRMNPGLKLSMDAAFSATFDSLQTGGEMDSAARNDCDVIIEPELVLRKGAVTMSATLREAASDNVINTYKASMHMGSPMPESGGTFEEILGATPCACVQMTSFFLVPVYTERVGVQVKMELQGTLNRLLRTITDDIRNDPVLRSRFGIGK